MAVCPRFKLVGKVVWTGWKGHLKGITRGERAKLKSGTTYYVRVRKSGPKVLPHCVIAGWVARDFLKADNGANLR